MTMEDMKALQTDYLSLPSRELLPLLDGQTFADSLTKAAQEILKSWDHVLNKSSIAAGIYNQWEREVYSRANRLFVPESLRGLASMQLTRVIARLKDPAYGKAELNVFVKESFEDAVKALAAKLGRDITKWTYGQDRYKHVIMEHPLNGVVNAEWKKILNVGPLPRGGNGHTPGSTGGADNQLSGASFRLIVDTGDWDQALMINTPGQSGDPKSPYYRNLFSIWANDQYFPASYSRKKVESVMKEKVVLTPGGVK
jgi:penicillin amidase